MIILTEEDGVVGRFTMGDVKILPKRDLTEEEQKEIDEAMAEADAYDANFDMSDDDIPPSKEDTIIPQIQKSIVNNGGSLVPGGRPLTITIPFERFLQGLRGIIRDLKRSGVVIVKARNGWKDKSAGITLDLLVGGMPAELKIHTPESLEIVKAGSSDDLVIRIPEKMETWHYQSQTR